MQYLRLDALRLELGVRAAALERDGSPLGLQRAHDLGALGLDRRGLGTLLLRGGE